MGGLSLSLLKHGPVKVFAEKSLENKFDKQVGLDVTRVSGLKYLENMKSKFNKRVFFRFSKSIFLITGKA